VVGKKYLEDQAAVLLKFAQVTTRSDVAARLLDKAAELAAKLEEVPDCNPKAPDVEQSQG
jgi:hypothetical protein